MGKMCRIGVFSMLLCWLGEVRCLGYYNVIGPRVIRPNSKYYAAVSIQATSEPTLVTATVSGLALNGTPFLAKDSNVVQPYSSRICGVEIGDLEDGDYKLEIQGTGGIDFVEDFPLEFREKSYSVFIQTDRAVYQPGTKILFRAIVLNSELKPAAEVRNELWHIHISDGKGNRVKEWRNIEAIRGVFTGDLALSENPVLGNWNISVTIHGQTYSKTIEVAEYVMPKFIIDIDAPKHVTFRENAISAKIDAKYTYGKKVKGNATVTVYPTIYSGVIQPIFQNPIRKVIEIDGETTVDFDIERDLGLNDEYERTVIVDVIIEEFPTGRRQNNSAEVHIHKYDYKMEVVKSADYFKPGLKYVAYVKVTNHDGSPISDDSTVIVRHGYSRVDEVYEEKTHKLDKNGIVKLEYFTPTNVTNSTALRIEAEYRDLKERMPPVPAAVSYTNTYLQVSLETDGPIVNLDVEVSVNCTEPMKYINYILMGRGDVLITNTFQVDNSKQFQFHFVATHPMVPVAHLIVYYVKNDGELVADALDIEVDGLLQNFIDIQINTEESEPDLDVELTIRAQQNSYIGLLAVDENVGMLRPGYDVTHDDVAKELRSYDVAIGSPYPALNKESKTKFAWKPGASNPHTAIYESGADLLTNAHVNRFRPTLEDIYLRPVFYGTSTVKPDRGIGLPLHSVTRPPLAGPYAFSRIPKPVWNRPKVYLTDDIAPTWLFSNFSAGFEGKTSIRKRLPGTLNTWSISGFSLDPLRGLGLVTSPKKIKVAKSFAVTLDLPFSVQRGEILAVPVVVYNHLGLDITAEITLHNPEQKFEFAEVSNEINATKKVELYRRKKVNVGKYSGTSVSFMITPKVKGPVEIKVTASSPRSQDVAIKNLLVTFEGETEYYAKSVLIDLRQSRGLEKSINFTVPKNVVEGSEKIEVSAVADLLGPTLINLENLIRLPSGCGEQNLIHFMPNLIILQYLKNTKQITPTIQNDAIDLLEKTYQQQLTYMRADGSFSPFGERDSESNLWVTAYVAMAFKQAKNFIYVDENIIDKALEWLANNQGKNGSFVETGTVIHDHLQNKNRNSLALTAFTLLAFLENMRSYPAHTNTVNKALDYIARNIGEDESTYTIALCSYALSVAKHPSKQSALNLLDVRSKSRDNMKWWMEDVPKNEEKNPWTKLPRSIDIEMTSYALLTFIENNLLDDATPVLSWLVRQENNLGGFASSQDTVVGLTALYKLVLRFGFSSNMQIDYVYRKGESAKKFVLNKNNALIQQTTGIPKDTREVNISAQGTGIGIFKVSYQYNVNVTGPWPLFTLDPQVDKNSDTDHLQVSICAAFVSRNLTNTPLSNMAVMEVTLPSGFTADRDSLPSLEVSQNVQKVQTSHGDTKIILYFNNLTVVEYCPTVLAFRTHKVAKQKPVPVVLYDYYDSSRRARVFYNAPRSTLCDICEGEDCGDICEARAGYSRGGSGSDYNGDSSRCSVVQITFLLVLFSVLIPSVFV